MQDQSTIPRMIFDMTANFNPMSNFGANLNSMGNFPTNSGKPCWFPINNPSMQKD